MQNHDANRNVPAAAGALHQLGRRRSSVLLLEYRPTGVRSPCAIGAVWCDERRVHWASPLNRRFEGLFNPLPFMLRFPEAQENWAHFALALEWFGSACIAARTALQIRTCCESEPGWHLSCRANDGPTPWMDLATQLNGPPDWKRIPDVRLRTAVFEAVALLVRERVELYGMALEAVDDGSQDLAWLHVTEGRRTLLAVHANAGLAEATALALESEERLRAVGQPVDRMLWVLPQMRAAGPIRLQRRITAVGADFAALARGLAESSRA